MREECLIEGYRKKREPEREFGNRRRLAEEVEKEDDAEYEETKERMSAGNGEMAARRTC